MLGAFSQGGGGAYSNSSNSNSNNTGGVSSNIYGGGGGGMRLDDPSGPSSSSLGGGSGGIGTGGSVVEVDLPELVLSHASHLEEGLGAALHTLLFLRERRAVRPVETDCVRLAPLTYARCVYWNEY